MNTKEHWQSIYLNKPLTDVSWYQPVPTTSLETIVKSGLKLEDAIIDIGGGDSFLSENLLKLGFTNITVLDISEAAIERAKQRMGEDASKITWIVSDILEFQPSQKYTLWHDRAAFHFLTDPSQIEQYKAIATEAIIEKGHLIIGTFSENGPLKCSGIEIQQYSETELATTFSNNFKLEESFQVDHSTPFDTIQNFTFVRMKKNSVKSQFP